MTMNRGLFRWASGLAVLLIAGSIQAGKDADLVIFDPKASYTVTAKNVLHRHPLTPYLGLELDGVVLETYVRGHKVYDHGSFGGPLGGLL